ncbi:hypothetical protein PV797_10920 [Clostridiaceae bacterium M8S5]|nr:hypothetical protein PV797_10920 [Clostridiaceae bacterium M8S5]
MKSRKWIMIIMIVVGILSMCILLAIEFIGINEQFHPDFIYDVSLALFGSSIILIIVSIIEYNSDKRCAMELFYQEILDIKNKFSELKVYECDTKGTDNFEELLKVYVEYSKLSMVNLGNLYDQMHFVFRHRKKREWIYSNLYNRIISVRSTILEATPHFQYYLQVNHGNKVAVSTYLTNIQNEVFRSVVTE